MSKKKTLLTLHVTTALIGLVLFVVYRLLSRDLPEVGVFAWRIALGLAFVMTYSGLWVYYSQRKWLVIESKWRRYIPWIALLIGLVLFISHVSRPTLLYQRSETVQTSACAFYPDMRLNMADFAQAHHHAIVALVTFDEHLETSVYRPLFTRHEVRSDMHTYAISILETPFYPSPKYIDEVVILQASKHAPHVCEPLSQDESLPSDGVYLVISYLVYFSAGTPPHQNRIMSLVKVDNYDPSRAYEAQDETVLANIERLLTPYD